MRSFSKENNIFNNLSYFVTHIEPSRPPRLPFT